MASTSRKTWYAHSARESEGEWHRLKDHLEATGQMAARFLADVGWQDVGRAIGLLHDVGKYTAEFQDRLKGSHKQVNHSTAGAEIASRHYGDQAAVAKLMAFCIAGHHAGLANGKNGLAMESRAGIQSLEDRLKGAFPQPDPAWKREVTLPRVAVPPGFDVGATPDFTLAFLCRMFFSALVDADFLDTEAWYGEKGANRGQHPAVRELSSRLDRHLDRKLADASTSEVNAVRASVLEHVRDKADAEPGVFMLTVPTGGGKTLTSLAFALRHALAHDLDRVIYVLPFTTIIEQTARVFRDALGEDNDVDFVVEHHSAFDERQVRGRESLDKLKLAMENWDAPVVVTTTVQFFESLFANRPSRCRKLHNIANSVIVLDEAQALPHGVLRPCVAAMAELARNWRTSLVLCTATQPALAQADGFEGGFEKTTELAPDPKGLYGKLKRTRLRNEGEIDDDELTARLADERQVLCIVNTRRHARELFRALPDGDGAVHLTTAMCAQHRRERLDIVRQRLADSKPVRLVATSLVEAGVDVDFPVVWRAMAGLESIAQAAGRCNREGRHPVGHVHVFTSPEGKTPLEMRPLADATRRTWRKHGDDPLSLSALDDYFHEVYWVKGEELDSKRILAMTKGRQYTRDFPFETIAREFKVIATSALPVIVPYDETARQLVRDLNHVQRPGAIARRLQPYVVTVPPDARARLVAAGAVQFVRETEFDEQFAVLENESLYSCDVGLTWADPTFREAESLIA